MESFWAMLKRGCQGVHHQTSRKRLNRYAGEFSGRRNVPNADTIDMIAGHVADMGGKRLTFEDLTADDALDAGVRK